LHMGPAAVEQSLEAARGMTGAVACHAAGCAALACLANVLALDQGVKDALAAGLPAGIVALANQARSSFKQLISVVHCYIASLVSSPCRLCSRQWAHAASHALVRRCATPASTHWT